MIVYRIANTAYSNDISGTGSKLLGGRWNSRGLPILYTSGHISLALLEMLVNTQFKDYAIPLDLLSIQFPDSIELAEVSFKKLKKDWVKDFEYTRFIGDEFLKDKQRLVLKIPSAVIHEEHNFLLNPSHPDFKKVKILDTRSFRTDVRLFSI
jgi:RES domain-containing protein